MNYHKLELGPCEQIRQRVEDAQREFENRYSYEQIEEKDPDLFERLKRQLEHFDNADHEAQIVLHGESLLRGYEICRQALQPAVIDFNEAPPPLGQAKHPGPPPPRRSGKYSWRFWYARYLRSADWTRRRALVLKRCGSVCEGCGTAPVQEVHHQTYDHVGYEFLFELIGLCHDCHARLHGRRR